MIVKWPGVIPAGVATGEFMCMADWIPTILSVLGEPDLKQKLLKGHQLGKMTYKVHLDGVDQTDLITAEAPAKRKEFYYFCGNDTSRIALRRLEIPLQEAGQVVQRGAGKHGYAAHHEPKARSV